MRRMYLALLLCFSTGAAADWTLMGGVTDIYSAYADTASARGNAPDHVQMWGLYNFSRPDVSVTGHRHQSTRSLREYDCATRRVRLLAFTDHTGPMGAGEVISSGNPGDVELPGRWEPVVSGAVDESFWKAACGR